MAPVEGTDPDDPHDSPGEDSDESWYEDSGPFDSDDTFDPDADDDPDATLDPGDM